MFKIPFLFILAVIISVRADAVSVSLTHDQFVHLTDSQKNEWIIKTMELMVDLENRYQREVKTSGFNRERFERYVEVMKKFQSLLIDSAYAAPSVSWETHGRNFSSLLKNTNGGKNCIYAGWVSKVVGQGGKEYCVHPSTYPNSPTGKAYAKGSACEGKNKITCNPAIFGYKNENAGTLFCVNAGLNEAHNSSYSCMKEALAEAESAGSDSKEVRLRNLRNRLSQNPAIFQDVQKFIFQTCVCETTPLNINARYHDYMRPHRTCYGMMEMLSATACEEPKIDFDTSFFVKLREFTNGKIIRSTNGAEVDATYTNYLNDIRQSASDEYARLCPQDGIVTKTPEITVKPNEESKTPETATPQLPNGGAATTPVTDLDSVEVKPDAVVSYLCKQVTCKAASADKTPPGAPDKDAPVSTEAKPTAEVKAEEPKTAEVKAETFSCEFEFTSSMDGVEEIIAPTSKPTEVPKSRDEKELLVKATFGTKTEQVSCKVVFDDAVANPTEEAGPKPTIKLALKDQRSDKQVVAAETTNEEGYVIKWYRKNFPEEAKETPKEKEEPKEDIKFAGATEEEKKPEPETPAEPELKGHMPDRDDYTEIVEPMLTKSYETCAILTAPGKESSDESCVKIPTKKKPAAVMPMQPQGPGVPPRGTTNTSALGIR